MSYDPFERGGFPVGVATATAIDPSRDDRALRFEIWYPASEEYAGRDLAAECRDTYEVFPGFPMGAQSAVRDAARRSGRRPLVFFSHGFGGHRRQSTFLCTHLASHGYVVASVDHSGNTTADLLQLLMSVQMGAPLPDTSALVGEFVVARPSDVTFGLDRLLDDSLGGFANGIDPGRIGIAGHSFGGWTALVVAARDRRIRAALPLAPAGGESALPVEALTRALADDWGRDVPTLFLVADRDTILPFSGMRRLFERTPTSKAMFVLRQSDHMHFCDEVEQVHELIRLLPPPENFQHLASRMPPIAELCTGDQAYLFVRGLGLAHMDAHLKGDLGAASFLENDAAEALAKRGVSVEVHRSLPTGERPVRSAG